MDAGSDGGGDFPANWRVGLGGGEKTRVQVRKSRTFRNFGSKVSTVNNISPSINNTSLTINY
jgi:hypothetical protein